MATRKTIKNNLTNGSLNRRCDAVEGKRGSLVEPSMDPITMDPQNARQSPPYPLSTKEADIMHSLCTLVSTEYLWG